MWKLITLEQPCPTSFTLSRVSKWCAKSGNADVCSGTNTSSSSDETSAVRYPTQLQFQGAQHDHLGEREKTTGFFLREPECMRPCFPRL